MELGRMQVRLQNCSSSVHAWRSNTSLIVTFDIGM
jgi:hypothetical protein